MEKQQIIDLIKQNPQMNYEEMKTQATEAGVPLDMFEEAWNEAELTNKQEPAQSTKSKKKVWIIGIIVLGAIAVGYLIINKNPGGSTEKTIAYESEGKTSDDCFKIAEKHAKEWSNSYILSKLGMGPSYEVIGESLKCIVELRGQKEGTSAFIADITDNEIKLIWGDNSLDEMPNYDPIGIPKMINSIDIYEIAKENEVFQSDLEKANELTGLEEVKLVRTSSLRRDNNEKDSTYTWSISIRDMVTNNFNAIHNFNAITGEYISERGI